jgi:cell division protein FtsN
MSKTFHSQRGNTFVGLFVGLVLGVVIAAGVVWYLNRSHSPFQNKDSSLHTPEKEHASATPGSPSALPAKPGDQDRFQFYKILPGGQDAAPAPKTAPPNAAAEVAAPTERYYLQAGAFQKKDEAENMKAQLALVGVEAAISEATIQDKGKMYRVRSGPYSKAEEMNRVRAELSQGGIQATLVKTKE